MSWLGVGHRRPAHERHLGGAPQPPVIRVTGPWLRVRTRWRGILAALRLPVADQKAVLREVELRLLGLPMVPHGAIELEDVWAVAAEAAWRARARGQPVARRVRFAVLELFRQEGRAHGRERRRRPGEHVTSPDPAQWRRCPCGETVASRQADYCRPCRHARFLEQLRAYRRRRKERETMAA